MKNSTFERFAGRALAGAAICIVSMMNFGCASGIQWRLDSYDRIHDESKSAGKLTLVYFRSWYSVACTKVEDEVFNLPAMKTATEHMNCLPLDFDADRALANSWGISSVPAFVIVDAEGRVLEQAAGDFDIEAVLRLIKSATEKAGAASRPANPR